MSRFIDLRLATQQTRCLLDKTATGAYGPVRFCQFSDILMFAADSWRGGRRGRGVDGAEISNMTTTAQRVPKSSSPANSSLPNGFDNLRKSSSSQHSALPPAKDVRKSSSLVNSSSRYSGCTKKSCSKIVLGRHSISSSNIVLAS